MRKLLLASVATLGATLALTGGAKAQPVKPVAPGTLVVHVNGYFQFEIGDEGSSFNTITNSTGTYKLNPVTTIGDLRLYPGFDAQTADGISYGVFSEIRTGYSDASVGENGKPIITTSSGASTLSALYVKRAYGYLGTTDYGYVRFGQTDSAFTLLQSGVVEAFGDGGQWTLEGGEALMLPSGSVPVSTFIYADQTAVYGTDKVVYVSPAFSGFSAVVGFEPNSNGIKEGYDSDTSASSTSANLSSSPTPGDIGKRRKNTIDAGVQYLDTIDGFKIKAAGQILHGSSLSYTGARATLTAAPYGGYDSLNVYQFGAQATFAGLTLGANIKGGQVVDGYGFKPKGGRDALGYIIGASYVFGPYVVGGSFFDQQSSGAYVPGGKVIARTLTEYGFATGANYVISPNLSLFTQYMYGHRHQPGYAAVAQVPANKRGNSQGQVIAIGATLKW
jgi:hypothetical protein